MFCNAVPSPCKCTAAACAVRLCQQLHAPAARPQVPSTNFTAVGAKTYNFTFPKASAGCRLLEPCGQPTAAHACRWASSTSSAPSATTVPLVTWQWRSMCQVLIHSAPACLEPCLLTPPLRPLAGSCSHSSPPPPKGKTTPVVSQLWSARCSHLQRGHTSPVLALFSFFSSPSAPCTLQQPVASMDHAA